MAKTNYAFAKRQRDLAKKRKREEKLQQRTQARAARAAGETSPPDEEVKPAE